MGTIVDSTTFMTTETFFKISLAWCGKMGHWECFTQKINACNCNEMERDGERLCEKGMVNALGNTTAEARL